MSASKLDTMDDPKLHFSGESKDWSRFKQDIQSRADRYDTTWLFEGGRQWALFLARQIKDKTGTAAAKKKALGTGTQSQGRQQLRANVVR